MASPEPTPSAGSDSGAVPSPAGAGGEDQQQGLDDELVFEQVNLTPQMYKDFVEYPKRVKPYLKVEGLDRVHHSVLKRELDKIKSCRTVGEMVQTLDHARDRWLRTELFKGVDYNFEPVGNGAPNDVLVRVEMEEKKGKQEFGIFTTDTAAPELRLKLFNMFGLGYSFQAQYVPPSSKTHSWSMQAITHTPILGDRFEFSIGQNKSTFTLHPADAERIEEVKGVLEKASRNTFQSMSAGLHRRRLAARNIDGLPSSVAADIGPLSTKVFVRHEFRYTDTKRHAHPFLFRAYPLPITGSDYHITNEISGGPLGGDVSKLTQDFFASKYIPLHHFVNLSLHGRAGVVWNLGSDRLLNDRLFLNWRQMRGFESVGPSTLSPEWQDRDEKGTCIAPSRFAAVGGNALWATTASLNFPLFGLMDNGILAWHLFANVGNLCWLPSISDFRQRWRELYQDPAVSLGAGLVMTQIPFLGQILPSGRVEFNVQMPLRFTPGGGLSMESENPSLFKKFRFGLIWSSLATGA